MRSAKCDCGSAEFSEQKLTKEELYANFTKQEEPSHHKDHREHTNYFPSQKRMKFKGLFLDTRWSFPTCHKWIPKLLWLFASRESRARIPQIFYRRNIGQQRFLLNQFENRRLQHEETFGSLHLRAFALKSRALKVHSQTDPR